MYINFTKTSHILFFGIFLPLFGFGLSWIIYKITPNLPFWLVTPSPIYAYLLLYLLFNNYIWHWDIFRFFGIVAFPDLRGRWKGQQISSHKDRGDNTVIPTYLEIKQTFSEIIIRSYYSKSQSESVTANFTKFNDGVYLFYTFDNEPNSLRSGTMQQHKGTVKLRHLPKENKLIGRYFNSIGNDGDLELSFEQSNLLDRF
jgi:hypothetical protein